MEFTATLVYLPGRIAAAQLSLALGAVVNESSRMGLPDELTLQRGRRARQQLLQWIAVFGGFSLLSSPCWIPVLQSRDGFPCRYGRWIGERAGCQPSPLPRGFASCNAGMMHACGHDEHRAGCAAPNNSADSWRHQADFSACERYAWARAMVDAGVVDVDIYCPCTFRRTCGNTMVCGSDNFMATPNLLPCPSPPPLAGRRTRDGLQCAVGGGTLCRCAVAHFAKRLPETWALCGKLIVTIVSHLGVVLLKPREAAIVISMF